MTEYRIGIKTTSLDPDDVAARVRRYLTERLEANGDSAREVPTEDTQGAGAASTPPDVAARQTESWAGLATSERITVRDVSSVRVVVSPEVTTMIFDRDRGPQQDHQEDGVLEQGRLKVHDLPSVHVFPELRNGLQEVHGQHRDTSDDRGDKLRVGLAERDEAVLGHGASPSKDGAEPGLASTVSVEGDPAAGAGFPPASAVRAFTELLRAATDELTTWCDSKDLAASARPRSAYRVALSDGGVASSRIALRTTLAAIPFAWREAIPFEVRRAAYKALADSYVTRTPNSTP